MDLRRAALLLAVVGLLCLPAPMYLGWAAEATAPPAQSSQIYAAEPIDLDNASDRESFVYRHGDEVTLPTHELTARHGDEYEKPNATRRLLVTAMRDGSASTVGNDGAQADLRRIDAAYEFVRDTNDDTEPDGYYRFAVSVDGPTTNVTAEPVDDATVADAIAAQAPRYEALSSGEQRTVDRIIDNSTGDDWGYRPYVDEPFLDELPTPIYKGDTLYSVSVSGHADDFGPGFGGFVAGIAVAIVGVMLLFTAAVVYLYDRYRAGSAE